MKVWLTTGFVAVLIWATTTAVLAEEITLADAKAQNLVKLSKDELTALLTGSSYDQIGPGTVQVMYTNKPDGTLTGNISSGGGQFFKNRPMKGNWSVNENGAYCVDAQGPTPDDVVKFCREIYKQGNGYYGWGRNATDTTKATKFTLKK